MRREKKIQSVLVDCQCGLGGTPRVKPLTESWANFWVARNLGKCLWVFVCNVMFMIFCLCLVNELIIN